MLPLFDMMANAQNGHGIDAMARQFGLSQQQTTQAMEALLPAFSQGLKHNAFDPYGIGNFMNALASGNHQNYFDNPAQAFSPAGMADGNGILGHLFGSKELSRAVAAQASAATGIAAATLQQMLPAMAAMIMGGLFKQSTGQMQAGGFGGGNIIGEVIEQMMRQQPAGQQSRAPEPSGGAAVNPFDNPFGKALEGMFGGATGRSQPDPEPQRQADPFSDNPLGQIFQDMLRGGTGGRAARTPEPEPEAAPQSRSSDREKNPYDELFGQMFETGRKGAEQYQSGVESIFDQFVKGMDGRR